MGMSSTTEVPTVAPDRRWHRVVLVTIVLAGLALRLFFASYGPRHGRFEDERFSLRNVRSIVALGTLEPASTYYPYPLFNVPPALLVMASDALHRITGFESLRTAKGPGRSAPATYLLCRWLQCLYGALALWLVYLLARRVASPEVGLLAAGWLAFVPWHVHASGYFKPDAQLTAMVLLALLWAARALEPPEPRSRGGRALRPGRWVLVGLGIALAMSSKLTGAAVAVSVAAAAFVAALTAARSGERPWRTIFGLGIAAVSSCAFFVALNPYWRSYLNWLGSLGRDYAGRAELAGMTKLALPARVLEFLRDDFTLGIAIGGAAGLAMTLGVVVALVRGFPGLRSGAATALLLSLPLIWTGSYAWTTAYFKPNNFLPLVPVACLLVAAPVIEGLRAASRRLTGARAPLVASAALLLVIPLAWRGVGYAYNSVIPTTLDAAVRFLEKGLLSPEGRLVAVERHAIGRPAWFGHERFADGSSALVEVAGYLTSDREWLDRLDGEVWLWAEDRRSEDRRSEDQSPGAGSETDLERRVHRFREELRATFEPAPFRHRGPSLLAVRRPRRKLAAPEPLRWERCIAERELEEGLVCRRLAADAIGPSDEALSIRIALPAVGGAPAASLRVEGQSRPMYAGAVHAGDLEFLTDKLEPGSGFEAGAPLAWEITGPPELASDRAVAVLERWRLRGRARTADPETRPGDGAVDVP